MSWFKVDDKFHGHEKVKRIPRAIRAEAIGTWTLCGTWSADHERDGYVPEHMIDELGATLAGAEALVTAKLWRRRNGGFVFINWAEWQPTREEQDAKRAATRNRVAEHRARKKAENTGDGSGDVTRYTDDVRAPRPVPSRPDPTDDDGQSIGDLTSEQLDAGQTVHNTVESVEGEPGRLQRIVDHVHKLTGRTIHPLEAALIREHYVDRAKTHPNDPTRYTLTCLTREEPIVLLNYLDTGRWSA